MNDPSEDLSEMKIKIFELQCQIYTSNIRLRAFQDYTESVWIGQGLSSHIDRSSLSRLEKILANELLRNYADTNQAVASVLKAHFDREFGKIDGD